MTDGVGELDTHPTEPLGSGQRGQGVRRPPTRAARCAAPGATPQLVSRSAPERWCRRAGIPSRSAAATAWAIT